MNWKYEAIEKLKEYSAKKQSLKSIPEEMARLESAMQSIRSATADGTPVSGGGSGREDMMLSNIVHREELARSLEQARKWVSLVDSGLESLSVDEKKILSRFYISPARGNVDALCEELGVEKPSVRFFDQVFAKIGPVDRSEVMIVGDSLTGDIRGGNNAGILTCWYNPEGTAAKEAVRIDHEIRDLHEVYVLLK